jgi:hypothetical protein
LKAKSVFTVESGTKLSATFRRTLLSSKAMTHHSLAREDGTRALRLGDDGVRPRPEVVRRYSTGVEGIAVLFWIAIWVCVAAPLALLVAVLIARMSADELPQDDPYSGALDPTLLDTDAHRDSEPKHPSPAPPTVDKTGRSEFHFTGAPDNTLLAASGNRRNRHNQH